MCKRMYNNDAVNTSRRFSVPLNDSGDLYLVTELSDIGGGYKPEIFTYIEYKGENIQDIAAIHQYLDDHENYVDNCIEVDLWEDPDCESITSSAQIYVNEENMRAFDDEEQAY